MRLLQKGGYPGEVDVAQELDIGQTVPPSILAQFTFITGNPRLADQPQAVVAGKRGEHAQQVELILPFGEVADETQVAGCFIRWPDPARAQPLQVSAIRNREQRCVTGKTGEAFDHRTVEGDDAVAMLEEAGQVGVHDRLDRLERKQQRSRAGGNSRMRSGTKWGVLTKGTPRVRAQTRETMPRITGS